MSNITKNDIEKLIISNNKILNALNDINFYNKYKMIEDVINGTFDNDINEDDPKYKSFEFLVETRNHIKEKIIGKELDIAKNLLPNEND